MQAFRIGSQLAPQLFDLGGGLRILLRKRVQIGLGGQRRGIRLAQLAGKALVLLCGRGHLLLQVGILLLCRVQRFRQPALPGVGVLQLLIRRFQRPFILLDGFLLKYQFLLKAGKLTLGAGYGLLKILHARGGPPEFALGLLNLFIDGREIPRKIISIQRKRHNKVAQDFTHAGSPPLVNIKSHDSIDKIVRFVYNISEGRD